jgi:LysM repeat protein
MAVTAIVAGFIALIAVVATSLGGDGSAGRMETPSGQAQRKEEAAERPKKGSYVVQSGDTLTSIAHSTGVPIARILDLNPGVDPRILVSGERLKLR